MTRAKMRRKRFKTIISIVAILTIISFSCYYYSKEIETKWIQITEQVIKHPQIPASFNGFKIIQFSDTHLGFQFDLQDLENVFKKIMAEKPDVIIFSGDLLDNPNSYIYIPEVEKILSKLEAPYGKFAVFGNHDHGGYGSDKYRSIMENSGFSLLLNESVLLNNKAGERMIIAGIDDAMLGKPDLEKTFQSHPKDTFTILISHAPDIVDEVTRYPVSLQISGHSHGGQVQFPFYGPLITPPYGQKYFEGMYEINDNFLLYVNRGLGTTRLPFRFLSRPEITTYTLQQLK